MRPTALLEPSFVRWGYRRCSFQRCRRERGRAMLRRVAGRWRCGAKQSYPREEAGL